MSILQEYDEIRRSLGEEVFAAIERYLEERPELFLSDIYYKKEEFEKFEAWYGKLVHEDNSDTAVRDVLPDMITQDEDTQLADEVINAPADAFGTQIVNIYKEILGWDNRMPKNYGTLMECYTGTPGGLSSFRAEGIVNIGNEYADVKDSISQHEKIYKYGSRMSEQFRSYIQSGQLGKLPYAYQTQEVSAYNRFLPGSLVVMEIWDFRVFSTSKKQYLGVYAGNGVFYLPGFEDSAFDTLTNLDGIERSNGMIKITQNETVRPFNKNAHYGFLGFCVRNISITNVYEPDLSLFTDPKYSHLDNTYFPSMSAARMSQIRYNEVQWQMDNSWHAPKVWDD